MQQTTQDLPFQKSPHKIIFSPINIGQPLGHPNHV